MENVPRVFDGGRHLALTILLFTLINGHIIALGGTDIDLK
jgi:hypothetical protein